jgi:hypothetical protein
MTGAALALEAQLVEAPSGVVRRVTGEAGSLHFGHAATLHHLAGVVHVGEGEPSILHSSRDGGELGMPVGEGVLLVAAQTQRVGHLGQAALPAVVLTVTGGADDLVRRGLDALEVAGTIDVVGGVGVVTEAIAVALVADRAALRSHGAEGLVAGGALLLEHGVRRGERSLRQAAAAAQGHVGDPETDRGRSEDDAGEEQAAAAPPPRVAPSDR